MRVESLGSVWFLDDDAHEYLRMPKTEGPRPKGPNGEDWGGPDAGHLQDLIWQPMVSWSISEHGRLRIVVDEDSGLMVSAPSAVQS